MALEITYNNFEISLVVFMQNITTNHAITYTNIHRSLVCTWVWFSDVVVVVNFLSQGIFLFLLFLGMVIYANEVETKEK